MKEHKKSECCNPHQIISDFYDKILAYVITRVKDVELAKDITQEVMGRLIDAYHKEIEIENIKAWLFQVSRNIIADQFRKKDLLSFDNEKASFAEESDEYHLSAEDFIIPMIQLLPEKYAKPLYMSDIEKIKQNEIAEKLNLSLSATKMRCQRARKMLHDLFLECCTIEYAADGSFVGCTIKKTCDPLLKEEQKQKQ